MPYIESSFLYILPRKRGVALSHGRNIVSCALFVVSCSSHKPRQGENLVSALYCSWCHALAELLCAFFSNKRQEKAPPFFNPRGYIRSPLSAFLEFAFCGGGLFVCLRLYVHWRFGIANQAPPLNPGGQSGIRPGTPPG